jgi:L-ascorbate metabolism protein UlaG (beta-lactamase superfamily)
MLNLTHHGRTRLWWLGQSGYLLHHAGAWLCFDPYLSDSLTRKYAGTVKPHERIYPIVVPPAELSFVDVATSTHNHTDHLDAETLLAMRPRHLVIAEANREFVATRLGCDPAWPTGLRPGEKKQIGPFLLETVPAKHEELTPATVGFIVHLDGGFTIYHSGDTLLYDDQVDHLQPYRIDLAILPINGKVGNMNHKEAAWLAHAIRARLTIPCHYDMFGFNTADPADFVAAAQNHGVAHRVLALGEGLDLSA